MRLLHNEVYFRTTRHHKGTPIITFDQPLWGKALMVIDSEPADSNLRQVVLRGVMVTPKKCKFLQLCEHQIGVQLTLLSCIFTPKWCKYDLHTILNAFKNTFEVLQQH